MTIYDDVRQALINEFDQRKKKNNNYSLRAYAKNLGIAASRLSDILNNKRNPSKSQLIKIFNIIGGKWNLQLTSIKHYENKIYFDQSQFRHIADWRYIAILSYLKERNTECPVTELVNIFECAEKEMLSILSTLLGLKLIARKKNGWVWIHGPEKTSDQVPNQAIREFHKGILSEAKNKIETVEIGKRDFSSMIMTIDPSKIAEAKEEIKSFRRKLSQLLESGVNKKQVYTLNIQFFPLSKVLGE